MAILFQFLRRGRASKVDPQLSIDRIGRDGADIVVSGQARLPDGARLRCGLWVGDWDGPFDGIMYGDTGVNQGRFACRFRPTPEWHGRVSGSVELRADANQPADVQAHIGQRGERLAYSDTSGKSYSQIFSVVTSDLTETEPLHR